MLPKTIDQIDESYLQTLISDQVFEETGWDYKKDVELDDKEARIEFVRDVCAMVNSHGGDLIIGIVEDSEHRPIEICGSKHKNPDSLNNRIGEILNTGASPPIRSYRLREIPLSSGGFAYVLRLFQSVNAPHVPKEQDRMQFWTRSGPSKKKMDIYEIRQSFQNTTGLHSQLTAFRNGRVSEIEAGTGVYLMPFPVLLIHVLPMTSFSGGLFPDFNSLPYQSLGMGSGQIVHRFDGLTRVSFLKGANVAASYSLIMRNGVMEFATNELFRREDASGRDIALISGLEPYFQTCLKTARDAYSSLGIPEPYFAGVALIKIGKYLPYVPPQFAEHARDPGKQTMVFPEHLFVPEEIELTSRKVLTELFQSFGVSRYAS